MKSPIAPVIGLVSALGMRATGRFIDLLADECRAQYGARHDSDFPRLLVSSQPPEDGAAADDALRSGLRQLEQAGADFLAVAGDEGVVHFPALAECVGTRVLNPVDLMLEAIPLSAQKVALVAAQPVLASEVFQRALWRGGHRQVDPGWQAEVDALLVAVRHAGDPDRIARRWSALMARAAEAGADTVLVTAFSPALQAEASCAGLHVVDGAQCLARAIVAEWLAWCVED